MSAGSELKQQRYLKIFMHPKGLANTSDLVTRSQNDPKLDMSPLCSKQTM